MNTEPRTIKELTSEGTDLSTGLPPGWRTTQLAQLLNPDQLVAVQGILKAHQDPFDALPTLRAYLDGFREDLLVKGVLSDYLAYAIVNAVVAHGGGVQ